MMTNLSKYKIYFMSLGSLRNWQEIWRQAQERLGTTASLEFQVKLSPILNYPAQDNYKKY